jgi:hypothetical protein
VIKSRKNSLTGKDIYLMWKMKNASPKNFSKEAWREDKNYHI